MYTVYMHINKSNGKVYIGMTKQNPKDRWGRGSAYKSQHFGRAIKKYGWDGFDHLIIADGLTNEDASLMEKALIEEHDARDPRKGYNVAVGGWGGGMLGKHHTEETKARIKETNKHKVFTDEHKRNISMSKRGEKHHRARKCYQYSKDGELIRSWEYMSLAAESLNINKSSIGKVCKGHRKTAGGFVWAYEAR